MNPQIGKLFIGAGLLLIIGGIIIYFFHDKLGWLGRLPGDFRYEGENTKVYFPMVTMIILSVLLTLIVNLARRFL